MRVQALRAVRVLKAAKAYDPFGVRWLMGRIHVSTPDDEIRADIMQRTKKWPEMVTREAMVTYALAVHRSNQRLYRQVTRGRF